MSILRLISRFWKRKSKINFSNKYLQFSRSWKTSLTAKYAKHTKKEINCYWFSATANLSLDKYWAVEKIFDFSPNGAVIIRAGCSPDFNVDNNHKAPTGRNLCIIICLNMFVLNNDYTPLGLLFSYFGIHRAFTPC